MSRPLGEDDSNDSNSLPTSRLGRKDYWEECYDVEFDNYIDHGDEGEVWFGKGIVKRIVTWMSENIHDRSVSILDIGCGNGHLLNELAHQGFFKLTGTDYVPKAVELAIIIARNKNLGSFIRFGVADITDEPSKLFSDPIFNDGFDIVLDKGTYDAICLNPYEDIQMIRGKYYSNLIRILKSNSLYIIASCNWTKDELLNHFCFYNSELIYFTEMLTPNYTYGGKKGNQVTCIILKKI